MFASCIYDGIRKERSCLWLYACLVSFHSSHNIISACIKEGSSNKKGKNIEETQTIISLWIINNHILSGLTSK